MLVRLLGPVELIGEAGPVHVGGAKQRTALAAMTVARPRPVDGSRLIGALWGEDPPHSAVKSMQAYISRLRSVVGDAITTTEAGYLLRADADLDEAERLVADGHRYLAEGAATRAADRFGDALALWRGPSLSGVATTQAMELERSRLDELARTTAEDRVTAQLQGGHAAALVGELEVMVGIEPLRERRWAQLMLSLYRSGRQADALRAYQRLRTTLAEQLGIDPSAELHSLERRILERDPSLGAGSDASSEVPRDRIEVIPRASPMTRAVVPLPDRFVRTTMTFAGRAAELARLRTAWDRATADGRRGVIVAGEPGIGKTTLVGRFARTVHADGAAVVVGECSEDLGIAHRPWIEILAPLVEHLPGEVLARHVDTCGGVLARLVPLLARRVALPDRIDVGPDAERYLLFRAVVDLLGRVPGPLLVVLEDLHWADRSSVQLLRHVIASRALPDVLVVGTYRSTDVDHTDPLPAVIAELRQVEGIEFVSLTGLDDAALLELVRETHEALAEHATALRDALTAETGGNPFFALEILRHLTDTGALGPGRLPADGLSGFDLPVSVRQVIGQRVARLGGTTHRVLREAAVIGREFDLDVLAGVAEIRPAELIDVLDAAVNAALVVNPAGDRFRFAHALIEHALYAELLPARRMRTHRRVAAWLEPSAGDDPGARAAELAHHWSEAAPIAGPARAIEWARRAGDHAMEQLAPDDAVSWYSRALELLEDASDHDELRRMLLVGLGNAERLTGDPMHRRRLLDAAHRARRVGDVDRLVEAALANNSGVYSAVGEVDDERVAVLELAVADVGDADERTRARLLATLSAELTFSGSPRTRDLAVEAVGAARRCGDADTLCDVLTLTEVTRRVPWLLDERERSAREVLDLTADAADPVRRFNAALKLHHVVLVRGERTEARRYLDEADSIAQRLGLPNLQWVVRRDRVLDAVLDGDLGLAQDRAAEALAQDTDAGQTDAFTRYSAQLMAIRRHQGRLGDLVPAITRLVADKPAVEVFRAVLASAHAAAGQEDLARPIFAELTADLDRVAPDPIWSTHMGLLADTAIALDDHRVAEDLYERLLPYGDQISIVVGIACDGAISHQLGRLAALLGRRRDAADHLADALERHRRLESPLHLAATERELSRLAP